MVVLGLSEALHQSLPMVGHSSAPDAASRHSSASLHTSSLELADTARVIEKNRSMTWIHSECLELGVAGV